MVKNAIVANPVIGACRKSHPAITAVYVRQTGQFTLNVSDDEQPLTACGCSTFGSVRDDCEQMTGRCVCKPGIQGQKCTVCAQHDRVLGPNGCVPGKMSIECQATFITASFAFFCS